MARGWSSRIFHKPSGHDDRNRDVFPLPFIREEPLKHDGLSRGTRRRIQTRMAINKRVNLGISALNSLYFGEKFDGVPHYVDELARLPLIQRDCIQNIREMVELLGPPPPDACCQGALAALRAASSSSQSPEPGVGEVVAMSIPKLSLPAGKVAGVNTAGHLEGAVGEVLRDFDTFMLQDASVWTGLEAQAVQFKPYNDPLLHRKRIYLDFLSHLYSCGVHSLTSVEDE